MDETENKSKTEEHDTFQELLSPKSETSPKSPSSPEPGCVICLGKLENKSFTDSCFHQFCFTCLLEWSKVKAECPLCKQPFKSIIHNVRSNEEYDQYHLRPQEDSSFWPSSEGRRFRYRSTLTAERRRELALERLFLGHVQQQANEILRYRWQRRMHHGTATEFRQEVYDQNIWAMPLEQMPNTPSRYRDVSAAFFHANPACTHRLVPWLNRELVVLLSNHESQIRFVLDLVMSLIQRYDILSPEFREHVNPYFGSRTDHFIHEFYNYARSPWDMIGYDRHSSYNNANRNVVDNEVIVLSPTEPTSPTFPAQSEIMETATEPVPAINNVLSEPSSSSSSSMDCNLLPSITLNNVKKFLSSVTSPSSADGGWPSPTVGLHSNSWESPYSLGDRPIGWPVPTSPQPGPSGINHMLTIHDSSDSDDDFPSCSITRRQTAIPSKVETVEDEGNDVDCHIVGYVKPIKERTPELIDLVSDSELSPNERSRSAHKKQTNSEDGRRSEPHLPKSSLDSPYSRSNCKSKNVPSRKECSSLQRESSQHWRWTAYEGGGGKFQRTYSPLSESSSSVSSDRRARRSRSQERHSRSRERTSSEKKHHHSSKHHHKKHKKHKRKHSHKEEKHSKRHRSADKKHSRNRK